MAIKTETLVNEFTINYLTEEQYEEAVLNGEINENEIYMTPSSGDGGYGLPEVTESDNGKIMQVVNGEWQLMKIIDAGSTLFYADGDEEEY